MLRFLGIPLQSIAMKRKVSTDLSEYDVAEFIRGQLTDITQREPVYLETILGTKGQYYLPMS